MVRNKKARMAAASPLRRTPPSFDTGAAAAPFSTPPAPAGFAATPRSTPPSSRNNKKALVVDPRLVVGAQVHTKDINVTSVMEVSRFRGALAKEVFMTGKLLKVVAGRDRGGRNKTDLFL